VKSINSTGFSPWELAGVILLSLVLSASVTAAIALAVFKLL
jgi:hypothetical protein